MYFQWHPSFFNQFLNHKLQPRFSDWKLTQNSCVSFQYNSETSFASQNCLIQCQLLLSISSRWETVSDLFLPFNLSHKPHSWSLPPLGCPHKISKTCKKSSFIFRLFQNQSASFKYAQSNFLSKVVLQANTLARLSGQGQFVWAELGGAG